MVDHSTLPSIADAKLPASYERAKTALSECSRIDECQEWADKAEALASYAKQSQDDSLRKLADRIQARAIRRATELLKQYPQGHGGDRKSDQDDGSVNLTAKQAATTIGGMSDRQYRTAMDVGKVPAAQFESLVESDNPPTVTKLAEMGKRHVFDLQGKDPEDFNKALHFVALFERHLRGCKEYADISYITGVLNDSQRGRLRRAINGIDAIHDQIMTRI